MEKLVRILLFISILSSSKCSWIKHRKAKDINNLIDDNDLQYAPLPSHLQRNANLKVAPLNSMPPTNAQVYAVNIETTNSSDHKKGLAYKRGHQASNPPSEHVLPYHNEQVWKQIQPLEQRAPLDTDIYTHHAETQKVSRNIMRQVHRFIHVQKEDKKSRSRHATTTTTSTLPTIKTKMPLANKAARNDSLTDKHRLLINTAHLYADQQTIPRRYKHNLNLRMQMMSKKLFSNTQMFGPDHGIFKAKIL